MQEILLIHEAIHNTNQIVVLDGEAVDVQYSDSVPRVYWRGMIFEKVDGTNFGFRSNDQITRIVHTGKPWEYIINGTISSQSQT